MYDHDHDDDFRHFRQARYISFIFFPLNLIHVEEIFSYTYLFFLSYVEDEGHVYSVAVSLGS